MTRGDPVTTFQKQSETCESLGAILGETNSRQGFSNIVLTFNWNGRSVVPEALTHQ